MMGRIRAWLDGRTPRERVMLAVMTGLMAVVVLWLGIAVPVNHALATARSRHADALEMEAGVIRQAAAIRSLRQRAARLPAPLVDTVAQSARDAGFTGARVDAAGTQGADVAIPAARAQALFAWLRTLRAQGIFPVSVAMRAGEGQTVAVEMRMRGPGG